MQSITLKSHIDGKRKVKRNVFQVISGCWNTNSIEEKVWKILASSNLNHKSFFF